MVDLAVEKSLGGMTCQQQSFGVEDPGKGALGMNRVRGVRSRRCAVLHLAGDRGRDPGLQGVVVPALGAAHILDRGGWDLEVVEVRWLPGMGLEAGHHSRIVLIASSLCNPTRSAIVG